ncbi:uncharacterized protein [Apostichopus japonicus]
MEIPVQSGGSVTLDCGFETTVTGRPLQWVTISPGNEPDLLAYSLEGALRCSEENRCTLHPNGSLELQDISLEDVDRMYRCQIGDGENYEYYSDHRLKVLVETCPLIKLSTATSAKGFKIDEQVMFSYTEPTCEDNADENYRATCYPPPGILMEGDYENIQCSCRPTDSACLTDRLNISIAIVQTWATMEITVQSGGSVTLDCGFETTVTGRPLQWVTILTGKEPYLFVNSLEGALRCSEENRCTLHSNGSLELQDITPEDVDRVYRCKIGDGENYEYYSDHHLNVLVETCPLIKLSTATSAKGFKIDEQVMFAYTEPICEDNADGNYRATCNPPPGILMEGDYENIQCSCTDSACLTDRLNISIASTKMLKEKMQPLGIGLITIAVVLAIAVALVAAVFATYYTTSRLYKKNEKGTASSQESGVPNSTNNTQVTDGANEIKAVQPSDQAITEASLARPETDEVDSGNNRASASPVKTHPVQTSVCGDVEMAVRSNEEKDKQGHSSSDYTGYHADLLKRKDDEKRVETSFTGATNTDTDNSDYDGDSDHEEGHPLLDSNDQNEVLAKLPAGDTKETTEAQMTVLLKDKKTVRPHADNGPKRPCKEYRILDDSKGERSFYFQFELKKPGVHLVLSTRREENSPSKCEIYFDEGKIRTTTEGKEGDSFPYENCGMFSMIMQEEKLSLSIFDEDEGWIPLLKWEEKVCLNECCFIVVFNIKFLKVEKCKRLTEFENPTSRTLSLHPKRE